MDPLVQAAMRAAFAMDLTHMDEIVLDTACALMNFERAERLNGTVFATQDQLAFVSDEPMHGLKVLFAMTGPSHASFPGDGKSALVLGMKDLRFSMTSRWYHLNAVLDFGNRAYQLVGPKSRMRRLGELINAANT